MSEDLLPALPAEEFERLKANIATNGVLYPLVIQAGTGRLIDGRNRRRAAGELGIEAPTTEVVTDDPEALGLQLNALRRQLSPGQRDAVFSRLRALGMSNRKIALATGVSHQTVIRSPGGPLGPPGDRRGKKPTPAELARRRELIVQLRQGGASVKQIADALGMLQTTVEKDLRITGVKIGRGRGQKLPVDPDPVDWRDGALPRPAIPPSKKSRLAAVVPYVAPEPGELYRSSQVIRFWQGLLTQSRDENFVNKLSHDALDAEKAGDLAWITAAAATITESITYAQRLQAVLLDRSARERGITWEERDDMAKPLRSVSTSP